MLPVFFEEQIIPGTFEYTLYHLIENELDLTIFNDRFHNDQAGAPAYDPKIMLKIILYAYSKGITASRRIEEACRKNITFMALSSNVRPHFTTIADFITSMDKEISHLFLQVLMVCDQQGLIGREMFAVDGCKMPSNASKGWSGTRADFRKKAKRIERAINRLISTHHSNDRARTDKDVQAAHEKYIRTLGKQLRKVNNWLDNNDDKIGKSGKPIKSNITDNESAKMKTSKGVIQGYNGVSAVDAKHQVIVAAESFGQAHENDLLEPMVDKVHDNFKKMTNEDVLKNCRLTADSGFHSEANMKMLAEKQIDGYVADTMFRKRDPRFIDYDRYKESSRRERARYEGRSTLFKPSDFVFPEDLSYCICPAGKKLYRSGANIYTKGHHSVRFTAPQSACIPCRLRSKCLRNPDRTKCRQVAYFTGRRKANHHNFSSRMRTKIDSLAGKVIYGMRLAVAEPPFAHIRHHMKLDRFTLRTKKKVNIQWKLFCIIHNLKKVQRYGSGFA